MESYILIISATITAIAVAYQIATNVKSKNITAFVIVDSLSGISYPVGVPNDISSSKHNNKDAIKVHLKIKTIKYVDFETIKKINLAIKWSELIQKIIKNDETDFDYSSIINAKLINDIVFDCIIDYPNPITTEITFDTNSKIKIKWK